MLIHEGRIIAGGTPEELKTKYLQTPVFEVETDRVIEAMAALDGDKRVEETSVFGSFLHVSIPKSQDAKSVVMEALGKQGIIASRVEPITPSLEDVFIHLIDAEASKAGGTQA
jgi:ABC-2 type transport system ATP-binding protein